MHHAFPVRHVERSGDLSSDPKRLIHRQRSLAEPGFERLALQILHHQVLHRVLAPDIVERTDVLMIQAGDGARFALEARAQSALTYFDGDDTVKTRIAGLIDFAHSPRAQQGNDLV